MFISCNIYWEQICSNFESKWALIGDEGNYFILISDYVWRLLRPAEQIGGHAWGSNQRTTGCDGSRSAIVPSPRMFAYQTTKEHVALYAHRMNFKFFNFKFKKVHKSFIDWLTYYSGKSWVIEGHLVSSFLPPRWQVPIKNHITLSNPRSTLMAVPCLALKCGMSLTSVTWTTVVTITVAQKLAYSWLLM